MCGIFGFLGSSILRDLLEIEFQKLVHRGPDNTKIVHSPADQLFLGFHRLAIMDLSHNGDQPFVDNNGNYLLCNGEIYNYRSLRQKFSSYNFRSSSDCEIIIPMMKELGIEKTCKLLDAEFVFIWYDSKTKKLLAARDPVGIRPLFYGITNDNETAFASEAKSLVSFCRDVKVFPPGHYYDGEKFIQYRSMINQVEKCDLTFEEVLEGIRTNLEQAVIKRLQSDAPVGFLLSGGLDSSLVCALAANYLKCPIKTFSIGSEVDAIDNKYAELAAKHIGAKHTTILFERNKPIDLLNNLIYMLETWDITTVRASIGMYLVCEYIKKNTDIKVLLTGEISDELFGYKYTDFAPSAADFQQEARKRIEEIHMYDVLRADRCISAHSLEARVPFGDLTFVDYVMSIPAELKLNRANKGKFLLRKAFENYNLLPKEILWREKAAFSDAVGHSMVDDIKDYADSIISDETFFRESKSTYHIQPISKEALLYRKIFENCFPNRADLIIDYWMPNRSWEHCDVLDPSARVLPNYGKSKE